MIALYEIRIGNYIWVEGTCRITDAEWFCNIQKSKNVEAVLLTPAIILQCDFEEIGTGINPDTKESETVFKNGDIYLSQISEAFYIKIGLTNFKVPSLHRLQNLYADLTGTELAVDLE